ncbi:LPXTG cell wall anchor domain-containing protein [Streptococcus suis]
MQVKKFAKWGLALTSTLVLGGAIAPVGNQLLGGSAVVYAQDGAVFEPYVVEFYIDGEYWGVANRGYNSGWPYVRLEPYSEEFPGKEWPSEELGGFTSNLPNVSVVTKEDLDSIGSVVKVYWTRKPVETLPAETKPVEKTAEQPVEQPTEQPVEQPTETPAEQPVEKPITYRIHYFLNDVVENGGTPSYTDIAPYKEGVISKGETIVEVAPHIDGYAVAGNNTIPVTYDHVTGDNVWHDEDWYPTSYFFYDKIEVPKPTEKPATTPIDQPAEQPVEIKPVETLTAQPTETPAEKPVATPTEKPAEQPVSTPTDQPTEKPTATSFLAGNTASKAQPVVTTDKNSTPSTPAVKPEEVSQPVAKTLPKTGDSSSMLLVLGGVLSGLSGLGLAATSRKRD